MPEAAHLGDQMQIRYGQAGNSFTPSDFQGPLLAARTLLRMQCSSRRITPSPNDSIPGCVVCYVEKITLPVAKSGVSEIVRVAALITSQVMLPFPAPGSGILTGFPFATLGQCFHAP